MEWWSGAVVGLRIVTRTGTGSPMVEQTAYQCAGRVMHREAGKKRICCSCFKFHLGLPASLNYASLPWFLLEPGSCARVGALTCNGLADPATDGDSKPGEGETDAERGWPYHLSYWRG